MSDIASATVCAVNLWIHSLGVSSCLTSRQNRLTSIGIFFGYVTTLRSVYGIEQSVCRL